MDMFKRLSSKLKLKPSFLAALLVLLLALVILFEWLIGSFFDAVQRKPYEVTQQDEKGVYESYPRDFEDDFSFLTSTQPSKLNGAPTRQSQQIPLAVVVENYTPIREQQVGLEEASLVYETVAEGGITRFLAIYGDQPVKKIGPVRSARPYFITWASEWLAPFVHVGGSPAALANLDGNFRVLNIDEFSDAQTIWRDQNYLAPHNAYTSTKRILERLRKEKYLKPLESLRFPFKDPDVESGGINVVSIDFSIKPYKVRYEYDSEDHLYARFNGGERHHEIKPANIVVQFVETEVLDDIGRLRVQTHGAGNALVFRDGHVIEATWEKDGSINSPDQPISESWTKFFDANGDEIALNRGQTWIEVVPEGRNVNYF